uniref:Uncharacterized protein n=1 Tax=Eutreptiella gymnastica TaxID=73025 RepID=A0A7S4GAJ7_9EUGL
MSPFWWWNLHEVSGPFTPRGEVTRVVGAGVVSPHTLGDLSWKATGGLFAPRPWAAGGPERVESGGWASDPVPPAAPSLVLPPLPTPQRSGCNRHHCAGLRALCGILKQSPLEQSRSAQSST